MKGEFFIYWNSIWLEHLKWCNVELFMLFGIFFNFSTSSDHLLNLVVIGPHVMAAGSSNVGQSTAITLLSTAWFCDQQQKNFTGGLKKHCIKMQLNFLYLKLELDLPVGTGWKELNYIRNLLKWTCSLFSKNVAHSKYFSTATPIYPCRLRFFYFPPGFAKFTSQ